MRMRCVFVASRRAEGATEGRYRERSKGAGASRRQWGEAEVWHGRR
jgi:hypothetical protein